MNAENYPLFLRQPERLWQLNGHELRSLVLEYPYSANLRLLLAQKAKMEDWPDAEALLAMAATYHGDRKQLHWQMRMLPTQRPEDAPRTIEEVLELKPLDEPLPSVPEPQALDLTPPAPAEARYNALVIPGAALPGASAPEADEADELVWPAALPEEAPARPAPEAADDWPDRLAAAVATAVALPLDFSVTVPSVEPEREEIPTPLVPPPFQLAADLVADVAGAVGAVAALADHYLTPVVAAVLPSAPPYVAPAALVADAAGIVDAVTAVETRFTSPAAEAPALSPREVIAPLPVETLPSYREQYRPARLSTLSDLLKAKTEKPAEKSRKAGSGKAKKANAKRRKPKTKEIARRSLETDAELGSETLAQLLERQGHYERALAMYERLRLSDPEKSGFFAARIQALREQINRLPPA